MAVTITAAYNSALTVTEKYTGPALGSSSSKLSFNGLNTTRTLKKIVLRVDGTLRLTNGAATLDLTNMAGWATNGAAANANGLRAWAWKIIAPQTNTYGVTLSGAYLLYGAGWSLTLPPGGELLGCVNAGAIAGTPTVGPGSNTLTLAGTGNSDNVEMQFIFG